MITYSAGRCQANYIRMPPPYNALLLTINFLKANILVDTQIGGLHQNVQPKYSQYTIWGNWVLLDLH